MNIELLLSAEMITARESDTLLQAGRRMARHNISALPVLRGGEITGILTERDLAHALIERADPTSARVRDHMTRRPVTVEPDAETSGVARQMMSLGVRHLPVVRDGKLVGMVSARDLLLLEAWSPLAGSDRVPELVLP
jgi:CBS domain-containing protein